VIIAGSLSLVHELQAADLVDEYRLLTFPTALRTGRRLFAGDGLPVHLDCVSVEKPGPATLLRLRRATR
jgi:dihydrofolate reductase